MQTTQQDERLTTAKMAWVVAKGAGLATVVASLVPGQHAAEAFELLRFATLLYAGMGAWEFVGSLVIGQRFAVSEAFAGYFGPARFGQV